MVYEKIYESEQVGLYDVSRMIGVNVLLIEDILEYEIVGIVDMESPSIYTYNNQFLDIIGNSLGYSSNDATDLYDYSLYKDKLKLVKGKIPENDYEVIVSNDLSDIFKLNKYMDDIKVNGKKLKVVGYYTSEDNYNSYFVSKNTMKYNLIENSRGLIVYGKDKESVMDSYREKGINLQDIYKLTHVYK